MILAALLLTLGLCEGTSKFRALESPIKHFDLSDVEISTDTFQSRAAASNLEYLLQLDPDRMLYVFRINAGLPTLDAVPFKGTWEDPDCELRGHFMGHYLTALAYAVVSTGGVWVEYRPCLHSRLWRLMVMTHPSYSPGNATVRARLELYIEELDKVQKALNEGGYLSAFPSEHFDRAEANKGVW
jgi:DUF1680 family protein